MLAGFVLLVGVYIAMNRFGVRLPLKPFFAVTSAFLYYMAFVFAGTGIAELQEGGFVSLTPVAGVRGFPRSASIRRSRRWRPRVCSWSWRWSALVLDLRDRAPARARRRAASLGRGGGVTPTPDLCDRYGDRVQVAEPLFRDFGGRAGFAGEIETVRVLEDNALVRRVLEGEGRGRVLVVDGAGPAAAR